ncbi:uncharacterized protein EI90DRAFT_3037256 [Cantharellus anzutake]|uniref:uncharacterized protein n=1 Tax=Cantharellus anzutake TaxID=1750568 RepID=UPI0019034CAA|nr:uncharacterized protein EI90DRAFT_3037256 [Cantharellus anzutake]KAF8339620.1 hypothetical protein EI90DRAFT_3037256 [Cantharellus anzutake]
MKLAELGVLIPSLPETVASITAGALNTVATAKDAEAGLPARHNSTVAGSLLVDIDNHIIGTCGAKELAVAAASTLVALKSDNVADAAGDAISIGIVAPTVAAQTLHSNFDAESGSLISARSEESTLLPDSSCGSAMTLVPSTDVTSPLEECDSPTEEDVSIELRAPLEQAVRFQECQDPEGQGEQHPSSIFAENANTANITVADPALTTIPILPSAENTRPSTSTKPPYSLFTLPKTCVHILSNPCLATAIVVTFRCFGQVAMGIVHRFVVLELESPPSSPVFEEEEMEHKWVRFDRRPDRNVPLAKIVASGARANDSTVFGRTKEDVLFNYPATLECQFRLKKTVQLQSLVPFFHIFMQTVPRYRFWRENCWFLSSLIAGLLVRLGDGQFEFGKLIYPNIAPELRRYLYLRYLVETNAPLDSLTEVEQVESLLIKYHPGKQDGAALVKLVRRPYLLSNSSVWFQPVSFDRSLVRWCMTVR